MSDQRRPSVGRIVMYVARGSADSRFPPVDRLAFVTEVDAHLQDGRKVGLMVANPSGLFFHPLEMGGVEYDPDGAPGTWHWPQTAPAEKP